MKETFLKVIGKKKTIKKYFIITFQCDKTVALQSSVFVYQYFQRIDFFFETNLEVSFTTGNVFKTHLKDSFTTVNVVETNLKYSYHWKCRK